MVFDIIVLVQFYNQDRIIFFGISLTILIIVQYAYFYISWIRWNPPDYVTLFLLCCCCFIVPFASTFPYWIYFGDKHTNCNCCAKIGNILRFRGNGITTYNTDSQLSQWKTRKLSKVYY